MTTYEPGTVAVATVRGVPNIRVVRTSDQRPWIRLDGPGVGSLWILDSEVTDVRPLIVLDLGYGENDPAWAAEFIVGVLRNAGHRQANHVADQIEAQTRPVITEPTGLGAVVRDASGLTWVRRHPGGDAWVNGYGRFAPWAEIGDVAEVLSAGWSE